MTERLPELAPLSAYPSLLRSSASSRALRAQWLRPLESAQSTCAPASPKSASTAWRGHPRGVVPSASVIVTRDQALDELGDHGQVTDAPGGVL
jgi:hypothetical protein